MHRLFGEEIQKGKKYTSPTQTAWFQKVAPPCPLPRSKCARSHISSGAAFGVALGAGEANLPCGQDLKPLSAGRCTTPVWCHYARPGSIGGWSPMNPNASKGRSQKTTYGFVPNSLREALTQTSMSASHTFAHCRVFSLVGSARNILSFAKPGHFQSSFPVFCFCFVCIQYIVASTSYCITKNLHLVQLNPPYSVKESHTHWHFLESHLPPVPDVHSFKCAERRRGTLKEVLPSDPASP